MKLKLVVLHMRLREGGRKGKMKIMGNLFIVAEMLMIIWGQYTMVNSYITGIIYV